MIWVLVGLGGAIGAVARHGLNAIVHRRFLLTRFPIGIFIVNVLGCFVIGFLSGLLASDRLNWGLQARTFVIVGVLGGFTTFSSFSLDTFALAKEGFMTQAVLNVAGQVGLSLLSVWAGFILGAARATAS